MAGTAGQGKGKTIEPEVTEWLKVADVPTDALAAKLANLALAEMSGPREFGSGSKGYHGQGKVVTTDGQRWQCSVQAVLVHSKNDASLVASADVTKLAESMGNLIRGEAMPRQFSSGKVGIYCQGKRTGSDGQSYQVQCQAVHVLDPATMPTAS